jgi:hypothetical protein
MTYDKSLEPGNILCKEVGKWREVAQHSTIWRAFVNMVMNIGVYLTVSMAMKFKEHLQHKFYFLIIHMKTLSVSLNAWSRVVRCLVKNEIGRLSKGRELPNFMCYIGI